MTTDSRRLQDNPAVTGRAPKVDAAGSGITVKDGNVAPTGRATRHAGLREAEEAARRVVCVCGLAIEVAVESNPLTPGTHASSTRVMADIETAFERRAQEGLARRDAWNVTDVVAVVDSIVVTH